MSFFAAFGYKTFIAAGDTCSDVPTASGSMTEVKNLTNFAIQSTSDTEDVQTYDYDDSTAGGWAASVVTGNSYTVDCTLNIDMLDAGYLILKQAALDSATGAATTDTTEIAMQHQLISVVSNIHSKPIANR